MTRCCPVSSIMGKELRSSRDLVISVFILCCLKIPSVITQTVISTTTNSEGTCEVGSEQVNSLCLPCERGFFGGGGLAICEQCPPGTTTAGTGSSTLNDCYLAACDPGHYRNMITNQCQPCDYGYFQSEKWQDYCVSCPNNFTTVFTGSTSADQCLFFCPAGTENVEGNVCTVCKRGYYRTDSLDDRFMNCTSCNSNFTTFGTGSQDPNDCIFRVCNAGAYRNETDNVCRWCPIGTYQPDRLQTQCLSCPNMTTTYQTGSVSSSECIFYCPAGYEISSAENQPLCQPCERGFFKTNDGNNKLGQCQRCPYTYTTDSEASDSADLCIIPICEAGQEIINSWCQDCPLDTFQPNSMPGSSDRCQFCPNGTGTLAPKQSSQSACEPACGAGKQYNVANAACVLCPMGTWNSGNITQRFEQCAPCPAGYTTPNEMIGATSINQCTFRYCDKGYEYDGNGDCRPCDIGKYKDRPGNNDMCVSCPVNTTTHGTASISLSQCDKVLCLPGQFRNSTNQCEDCPLRSFQEESGQTQCKACPANYITADIGSDSPVDCIVSCPMGHFPTPEAVCVPCPQGLYQTSEGSATCQLCPQGTTTLQIGAVSLDDCVVLCLAGQFRNSTNQCEECPRGSFQEESGQTQCVMCPVNSITVNVGSDSLEDCIVLCDKGQYLDTDTKTCVACTQGSYNSEAGTMTSAFTACLACPPGLITLSNGSVSESECNVEDCQAGFFRSEGVGCQQCPLGTYQSLMSQNNCMTCPSGQTTLLTGRKNKASCVTSCADGQQYNFQTGACDLCPIGFYSQASVTLGCIKCEARKTTLREGDSSCIDASISLKPYPLKKITITVKCLLRTAICTNKQQIGNIIIDMMVSIFSRAAAHFTGLCQNQCTNLNISFITGCLQGFTREKRNTDSEQEVDVVLSGVDNEIQDIETGNYYQTVPVVRNVFYDLQPEQSMLDQNLITFLQVVNTTYFIECQSGSYRHGIGCFSAVDATTTTDSIDDGADDDETNMIAGIVGGVVAVLLLSLVIVAVIVCWRRAANKNSGSKRSLHAPRDARVDDASIYAEIESSSMKSSSGGSATMYLNPVASWRVRDFQTNMSSSSTSRRQAFNNIGNGRGTGSSNDAYSDGVSTYAEIASYTEIDDSAMQSYSDRPAITDMNATINRHMQDLHAQQDTKSSRRNNY